MLLGPRGSRALLLLLALLLEPGPGSAWYKHAASRRYHTVGRASGLLMGIRRSPYMWRREEGEGAPALTPRWGQPLQESPRERQGDSGGRGAPEEIGIEMQAPSTKPGMSRDMQAPPTKPGTSRGMAAPYTELGRQQPGMDRDLLAPYTKHSSDTQAPYTEVMQPPYTEHSREQPGMSRDMQTPYTKPGMDRDLQELISKGAPDNNALFRGIKTPHGCILTSYQKPEAVGMGILDPLINQTPEDPGRGILTPYSKWTSVELGMNKDMQAPSIRQTPEVTGMNKVMQVPYSKQAPETDKDICTETPKSFILALYRKRTPEETGMGRNMEAPYNKLTQQEMGMDKGIETPKRYTLSLYKKQTQEETSMDRDLKTSLTKWNSEKMYRGIIGPLIKRIPEETGMGSNLEAHKHKLTHQETGMDRTMDAHKRYILAHYTKWTPEETGMDKDLKTLFTKWNPEEMDRSIHDEPLIIRTPQKLRRPILAPHSKWTPDKTGIDSVMQTLQRTGTEKYLPSVFTKRTQDEAFMDVQDFYHKRSREATGTVRDIKSSYTNPRGA